MTFAAWKTMKSTEERRAASDAAILESFKTGARKGEYLYDCQGWKRWTGTAWEYASRSNRPSEA